MKAYKTTGGSARVCCILAGYTPGRAFVGTLKALHRWHRKARFTLAIHLQVTNMESLRMYCGIYLLSCLQLSVRNSLTPDHKGITF